MLTELRSEKFEWFGPSPIEPFNLGWNPGDRQKSPRRLSGRWYAKKPEFRSVRRTAAVDARKYKRWASVIFPKMIP